MTKTISRTCMLAMLSIGVTAYAQTTGQNPTQPPSQAGSQRMEQPRQAGDRTQTGQQMTLVGCVQREADFRQANQGGRGGTMGTGLGVGNEFVLTNAANAPASGSQTAMSGTTPQTGAATAGTSGTATTGSTATTGTATGTTSTTTTPSHTEHSGMSVSAGGQAYALTGDKEKELEQYVGQRLEIVGQVEGGSGADRSGATASGSGSATGTSATGTTSGTTTGTATGTTSGTATTGTTSGTATAGTTSGGTQASASAGQSFGDLKELRIVSFRPVGGSCAAK
jgi:hypothetical protein